MPLPLIGTTPGVQVANQSVAETSDAAGALTFTGPSGIQGSTITCHVTVPNAPGNATFTATLGTIGGQGVIVDTWGGESTAGPFQIGVGQTLVVAGSDLVVNTQYTCTFATVTDVGAVQAVLPAPNSSAQSAQVVGTPVDVLASLTPNLVVGTPQAFTFTALHNYQCIGVVLNNGSGAGVRVAIRATSSSESGTDMIRDVLGITPPAGSYGGGVQGNTYYLPIAVRQGDTVTLSFQTLANSIVAIVILGLGASPAVMPTPGFPLDVVQYGGAADAQATGVGGAAVSILPNVGAGLAYRIHMFNAWAITSGSYVQLLSTNVRGVIESPGGSLYMGGQLFITGAVNVAVIGGGTGNVSVTYDLVTLPSIT